MQTLKKVRNFLPALWFSFLLLHFFDVLLIRDLSGESGRSTISTLDLSRGDRSLDLANINKKLIRKILSISDFIPPLSGRFEGRRPGDPRLDQAREASPKT